MYQHTIKMIRDGNGDLLWEGNGLPELPQARRVCLHSGATGPEARRYWHAMPVFDAEGRQIAVLATVPVVSQGQNEAWERQEITVSAKWSIESVAFADAMTSHRGSSRYW